VSLWRLGNVVLACVLPSKLSALGALMKVKDLIEVTYSGSVATAPAPFAVVSRGGLGVNPRLYERMSQAKREAVMNRFGSSAFGIPERLAWPIYDARHALIAISYMRSGRGRPSDYSRVVKAIKRRWVGNDRVMAALSSFG